MLGNVVPLWEVMLAAIKLGAVVIPASTLLQPADLADRITRGHVRHVVAEAAYVPKFAGVPGEWTRVAVGTEGHFVRNLREQAALRGVEVVHLADVPDEAHAGCGCATMSRNDPPHLVALLALLAKGKAPDLNRVLPGDMVDEISGARERLDVAGQAGVARDARRALERMIEITEAAG